MLNALLNNKIVCIGNEESDFFGLNYDIILEDKKHTMEDYIHMNGEFILKTDEKAIRQQKEQRINELKELLANADYWGQKYLDGEYTDEEWNQKVAQRKAWREEIRSLEV